MRPALCFPCCQNPVLPTTVAKVNLETRCKIRKKRHRISFLQRFSLFISLEYSEGWENSLFLPFPIPEVSYIDISEEEIHIFYLAGFAVRIMQNHPLVQYIDFLAAP